MGSAYKDIYSVVQDSAKTFYQFKSPKWFNVFMKIHVVDCEVWIARLQCEPFVEHIHGH